ncbi:MAG: hypothetical protein EXQ70_11670 [Solirubrobacterales bacterium]|nr:hypothetical protein [Solirubrobacterales bacterium]
MVSNNVTPPNAGSSELLAYPDGITVVPPKFGGQFAIIAGSSGPDKLKGTPYPDVIALGGEDKISGLAGKEKEKQRARSGRGYAAARSVSRRSGGRAFSCAQLGGATRR